MEITIKLNTNELTMEDIKLLEHILKLAKSTTQQNNVAIEQPKTDTPKNVSPFGEVKDPTEPKRSAMALKNYAFENVKPYLVLHYKALLTEYGVSRWADIPNEKVEEVWAKLDLILKNVVDVEI